MLKTRRSLKLKPGRVRRRILWWVRGWWLLLLLCWGCQQPPPPKAQPSPKASEPSPSARAILQQPKIAFSTPSEGLLWEATAEKAEGIEASQQGRLYQARVVFYKQGRPSWECKAGLLTLDGRRKRLRFLRRVSARSFLQPVSFQAETVVWYADTRYVEAWGGVRLQMEPVEVTGNTLTYQLDKHTWQVVGNPLLRWKPMLSKPIKGNPIEKPDFSKTFSSPSSMEQILNSVFHRTLCLVFSTLCLFHTSPMVFAQAPSPPRAIKVGDLKIGSAGSISGKTLKKGLEITARKNAWMVADGLRLSAPVIMVTIPKGGPFDILKAEGGIQLRYRRSSSPENPGSASPELLVTGQSLSYQREKDLARIEGGVSVNADLEAGGTITGTAQRAEIQLQQRVAYLIGGVTLKFNDPQTFAEPGVLRGDRLKIDLRSGEWELLPGPGQQTEGSFKLKPSSEKKEGSKE